MIVSQIVGFIIVLFFTTLHVEGVHVAQVT